MKDLRGLLLHAPRRYRRDRRAATMLDAVCRLYGTPRLNLPAVDLETLFPGFTERQVTVRRLALGSWSSPAVAQVVLAKLAGVIGARRLLELGSFRGYTARLLAENLPDAEIVALDTDAKQGEAFRCSEVASRIAVVTGTVADFPERANST